MGLEGRVIDVEVAVAGGLPRTVLVGLPDASLYEARDRCRAAAASAGLQWPSHLVTINLSPASLPKAGSHYDVAIIAATLAAAGEVPADRLATLVLLGELGLDGRVRAVRGLLPAVLGAVHAGWPDVIVPREQLAEARLAPGVRARGVADLGELLAVLQGRRVDCAEPDPGPPDPTTTDAALDLADVVGQPVAKHALEVAAAGGHHLMLWGPPGVGKSMLASRLPTILPALSVDEGLEVAAVRSLAGLGDGEWTTRPPWSNPHHTASVVSMVGGGSRVPVPGAISLAHRGVLFLDEACEFGQKVIDSLREPLENGEVFLTRSAFQARYPARFQLVLAANPCPCGYHGVKDATCRCTPVQVRRYQHRLSGPILDRVDIQVDLEPRTGLLFRDVSKLEVREPSGPVAERVLVARERQRQRLAGTGWRTNAEVPGAWMRTELPLPAQTQILEQEVNRGALSARGVDKCVRLAWTLADLAGRDVPSGDDVRRALELRLRRPTAAVA